MSKNNIKPLNSPITTPSPNINKIGAVNPKNNSNKQNNFNLRIGSINSNKKLYIKKRHIIKFTKENQIDILCLQDTGPPNLINYRNYEIYQQKETYEIDPQTHKTRTNYLAFIVKKTIAPFIKIIEKEQTFILKIIPTNTYII